MTSAFSAPRWSMFAHKARVVIAGICALVLTVGVARFAYTPLLPVMRDQAGLSVVAGGWLATINYAGYVSGALVAATVSRLEYKFRLYRLGLVLALLSTAGMGVTHSLIGWAILRYIGGLASVTGLLLASGLVLNWLIRHGQRPLLGVHFAGMGLGIVLSGVAVQMMAGRLAWDREWLMLAAVGVVFFVPAWFWMPSPAVGRAQPVGDGAVPTDRTWLITMIAAYFCAGIGYVISATFIVEIVRNLPLMVGKGNLVWVIVGLAALPSSFLWDRVQQAWGVMPALIIAYVVEIISILLPALFGGVAANMLAAVLFGGTFVGIVSLTLSLIGRRFPANPAKAMARLTLSYGVAQILAPAMAGAIAAHSGSYRGALFIAAIAMLGGVILLFVARSLQRSDA